jgi:Ni,Fe-hydrogenase III component G
MTASTIADQLSKGLNEKVHIEYVNGGDTLIVRVDGDHLVEAVQYLRNQMEARFMYSVGMDTRKQNGCLAVNQVIGLDRDKSFLVLRTDVNPEHAEVPSLTPMIPGANWHEREVRDMIGIAPIGHPDPRRLVLPDDFPADSHPLRRDYKFDEHPPQVNGNPPLLRKPPKGARTVPIGPFYPTLEEPVFINLFVEGEHIVDVDYRGFYGHRGVEKLGDSDLTYQQVPFLAERICGI